MTSTQVIETLILEPENTPLQQTKYKKSVKPASDNMFKPGKNNKKLGNKITIGMWKGMSLYSLTLEERSTCPSHCEQWDSCYGNNMPFAYRYDHTDPLFYTKLADQLASLSMKHESGFVIRLHVLGDFFDKKYVHFWRTQLFNLKNLHIYGYTHCRSDSDLGAAIYTLNNVYKERCRVRFSDDPKTYFSTSVVEKSKQNSGRHEIVCPEQLSAVSSCSDCGICWESTQKHVVFLTH